MATVVMTRLLANIRTALEVFLDDTCTISRERETFDSMGGSSHVPEIVASGVSCRVIMGKSDTENIGNQESLTETYRLIVPVGTELDVDYIVTLADETVYQVIEIITQRSDAMDAQVMMKRVRI